MIAFNFDLEGDSWPERTAFTKYPVAYSETLDQFRSVKLRMITLKGPNTQHSGHMGKTNSS